MSGHTPGPWYLIAKDGSDFTAISTKPRLNSKVDLDSEVLGSSEWIRWRDDDASYIVTACNAYPDMLAALKLADRRLHDDGYSVSDPVTESVRAAIAKADPEIQS